MCQKRIVHRMKTNHSPDFSQLSFSAVVGLFVLVVFAVLGYMGSRLPTVHGRIIPWPISTLTELRMWWTIPLGVVAMLFLLLKDRTMQPRRSAMVNTIVFAASLAVSTLCIYLMVFRMYEVIM